MKATIRRALVLMTAFVLLVSMIPVSDMYAGAKSGQSKTVTTAKQLRAALKNKNVTKITLKSKAAVKFTIPKGNYSGVKLVVNTPNAEVVNKGVFASVTLKSDRFTEKASGNTIRATGKSAHIKVTAQAQPAGVTVTAAGANAVIMANGTVGCVKVNGAGAYALLVANQSVGQVVVNGTGAVVSIVENASVQTVTVNGTDAGVLRTASGKSAVNEGYAAKIGNSYYTSLRNAIRTADTTPITVTLLEDVSENVLIDTGMDITLNLNGCRITNLAEESGHTITVVLDAKLTIEGEGTVENGADERAAVYNCGTVVLNGGTYQNSNVTGAWFTLCNHGTMTINSGVTVTNVSSAASLVQNGYSDYAADYRSNVNARYPLLTVNDGAFQGGLYSVQNDAGGRLALNGGVFSGYAIADVREQ